ncbi:MAG: hypothetical protein ACP5QX_07310 [Caldisericaceae bacterium]
MNCNRVKQSFMAIPIAGMIFFLYPMVSYADWQIDVSRFRDDICRTQYDSRLCSSPSRIGNFATQSECDKARYQYCGGRGDAFCMRRIYCTGYDRATPSQTPNDAPSETYGNQTKGFDLEQWAKDHGYKNLEDLINKTQNLIDSYRKQEELKDSQNQKDFVNENKSLLMKLKSGKDMKESISGFKNEDEKNEYINAVRELSCTAEYSLEASNAALAGDFERARESAGCIFDYFGAYFAPAIKLSKCSHACNASQTAKVYIPDVPPPVKDNPQAKVYSYIRERSNKLLPEIINNKERLEETEYRIKKLEEQRSKIKEQKAVVEQQLSEVTKPEQKEKLKEEKAKFDQDDASLLIEAERLKNEASEMNKKADTYRGEIFKLNRYLADTTNNPESSESIYKEIISAEKYKR